MRKCIAAMISWARNSSKLVFQHFVRVQPLSQVLTHALSHYNLANGHNNHEFQVLRITPVAITRKSSSLFHQRAPKDLTSKQKTSKLQKPRKQHARHVTSSSKQAVVSMGEELDNFLCNKHFLRGYEASDSSSASNSSLASSQSLPNIQFQPSTPPLHSQSSTQHKMEFQSAKSDTEIKEGKLEKQNINIVQK